MSNYEIFFHRYFFVSHLVLVIMAVMMALYMVMSSKNTLDKVERTQLESSKKIDQLNKLVLRLNEQVILLETNFRKDHLTQSKYLPVHEVKVTPAAVNIVLEEQPNNQEVIPGESASNIEIFKAYSNQIGKALENITVLYDHKSENDQQSESRTLLRYLENIKETFKGQLNQAKAFNQLALGLKETTYDYSDLILESKSILSSLNQHIDEVSAIQNDVNETLDTFRSAGTIVYYSGGSETFLLLADHIDDSIRGWAGFGGKRIDSTTPQETAAIETCQESRAELSVDMIAGQIARQEPVISDAFYLYFVQVSEKYDVTSWDEIKVDTKDQCYEHPIERGPFKWITWEKVAMSLDTYKKGNYNKNSEAEELTMVNNKKVTTHYYDKFLETLKIAEDQAKIPW